jgi:tRNA A-37 threonylcarbamoyl transferase component Bud32
MTEAPVLDESLRAALLPELEPIRALGSGATAHVYLAREPALARLVAVKVLRAEVAEDAVARQRFEREAQAAARIAHPHVTAIYRVGRVPDGRPYIVMEYVEGRTLTDVLAAGVVYDEPAARELLAALASALAVAHEKGIIHRDVRPANVLLENRTGRAVLGDFGVAGLLDSGSAAAARLTTTGMVLGDPRYHSPEQVRGEPAVEQSDVYALGLLAFELLAGRSPYDTRTKVELLAAHANQRAMDLRAARPDVSPGMAALVARCLAKDPNQRPLAREVAARLSADEAAAEASARPAAGTGAGSGAAAGGSAGGATGSFAHFLAELRRRNVYQVMAAYSALAIAIFGIAQGVFEAFDLSRGAYRLVVGATLAGFPVAMVLAWVYDIHSGGIRRTRPTGSTARARALMWVGFVTSLLLAGGVGWLLLR